MSNERRRRVDGDDSLLASVAGVPLTRMARIAVCLVWAGFWAVRIALTDALYYFQRLSIKSALTELLGDQPVDQAFSICMVWLSVEVAVIGMAFLSGGIRMLIAKTPKGLKASILAGLTEGFTPEELEATAAKMRKARQEKANKENGKKR